MIGRLLIRGMLAGLAAGAVAFVVAYLLGEGPLSAGVAYEHATTAKQAMPGMAEEPELVSRTVQATLGLGVVALLFGVALGGLFGLAFAATQGRLGNISTRASAAVVAVAGFVGVYLIPQLKYPSNPPGVNAGDSIGARTGAYLAILVVGVAVVIGVIVLARRLRERFTGWNATLLAMLTGAVVLAATYLLLPRIDETPPDFPATVLWQFRVSSFAAQAALWTSIGLLFGTLTDRAARREHTTQQHRRGQHPEAVPG